MLKKIQTAEEKERKEKRTRTLMAILVTVILGASTAAYALMDTQSSEKKSYNGFTFTMTQNGWQAKKMNFFTKYLPQDVENITIPSFNLSYFSGNIYLVAIGSQEMSAATELLRTLQIEKVILSCTAKDENTAFCSDLPIKSCDDARSGNNVIIFESANETSVAYNNYCLTVKGESENLVKASDRIIFSLYNIIKTKG
jgi:hypothetical protein